MIDSTIYFRPAPLLLLSVDDRFPGKNSADIIGVHGWTKWLNILYTYIYIYVQAYRRRVMENPPFFTRYLVHSVLYVDFFDIFFLNSIDDLLLLEGRGLDFPRKEGKRARLEIWKNFFSPSEKERKYRRRRGGREFRATTAHAPQNRSFLPPWNLLPRQNR